MSYPAEVFNELNELELVVLSSVKDIVAAGHLAHAVSKKGFFVCHLYWRFPCNQAESVLHDHEILSILEIPLVQPHQAMLVVLQQVIDFNSPQLRLPPG